jgi:lysophospholipase L1-like esterase
MSKNCLVGRLLKVCKLGTLALALIAPEAAHAIAAHRNYSYEKTGATRTTIVAAYGDSIVAGYCGVGCTQNSYAQFYTHLNKDSTATALNSNINGWIRAVSGHMADQVVAEMKKDVANLERADVVTLEACGNDYLTARSAFQNRRSKDYCNKARLDSAVADCKDGISQLVDTMASKSKKGALLRIMNIYYPGMLKDAETSCKGTSNADHFLRAIVEGNWFTCDYAYRKGIACVDAFADFNTADSNRSKIAWRAGESLEDYSFRLTVMNRDFITDPTKKKTSDGKVIRLLLDDNTHPNQTGHARIGWLHHYAGYRH